jgi:hypothetical protein
MYAEKEHSHAEFEVTLYRCPEKVETEDGKESSCQEGDTSVLEEY